MKKLLLILALCLLPVSVWAVNPYIAGIVASSGGDSCSSGATILGTSDGDTSQGVGSQVITSKYTASCDGSVASIVFYATDLVNADVKAGIYTDSGTEPDQLVSNSAITVLSQSASAAEVTLTYPSTKPSLTKGTVYWVVIQCDVSFWAFYGDDTSGGDVIRYAKTFADVMPQDFDAQGYSKYTYTAIFEARMRLVAE